MFNYIPTGTKNIILINIVLYLLTQLFEVSNIRLTYLLGIFYPQSPNFQLYQILTHMFMHGNLTHLILNMYGVLLFGSILERSMGRDNYIVLYLFSGLGAFFIFNLVNYFAIQNLIYSLDNSIISLDKIGELSLYTNFISQYELMQINDRSIISLIQYLRTPMIGASGCIFGLLSSFAVLYPNQRLIFVFFPLPMKAKYVVLIYFLIELYLGFYHSNETNIAHFAHVGGAIFGFFYTKYWKKNNYYEYFQ